jgi:hypothetical protein
MKGYMLAQLAFWLQQLIVINIEERRKDHWQMFTHHIVTSTLVYASYRYGYTRVGNLTLVLMDVVDLFLPVCCDILMRFAPVFVANYVVSNRLPSVSNTLATPLFATGCSAYSWFLGLLHAMSCTSRYATLSGRTRWSS